MQRGNSQELSASKFNIKVYVRLRPLNKSEESSSREISARASHHKIITLFKPSKGSRKEQQKEEYAFNYVFDQNDTSEQVFEVVGRPILRDVKEGHSTTVFAYGSTGSGKTHT